MAVANNHITFVLPLQLEQARQKLTACRPPVPLAIEPIPQKRFDLHRLTVRAAGYAGEHLLLEHTALVPPQVRGETVAFGTRVSFGAVELEGIGAISIDDIRLAADMGYRIKLLGVAQMTGRGLEQRMTPCLVPADSPLGQLQGGTNMVVLEGDAVGQIVLRGPGAGEGPTASAVMADVIDIARGLRLPTFGQPAAGLAAATPAKTTTPAAWYLRMTLLDKPGALAKIATCLGEAGVSIDQMRQYGHLGTQAPVLIVTHKATRDDLDHAMTRFAATGVLVGQPVALRIEEV